MSIPMVAATLKYLAEVLLTLPAAVGVGGVEEGDALLQGLVHHRAGAVEVDPAAEVVAAQADH
jgi:hypothetical protein